MKYWIKRASMGLVGALIGLAIFEPAHADEGMFTPDNFLDLTETLESRGLDTAEVDLSDLTGFPMGAVVSLGGCTGSFVSPRGLVVTNHHCARGSIQYVSTPETNYLEDGFLAERFVEELPAAPGTRVYVTVASTDVTDQVLGDLPEAVSGREIYSLIEARRKELVGACEEQAGHRCRVAAFYGGAEYRLIDRLEIQDVRLVYAPADSVGKFGGDIDNWMWPRHTGDFAFYRAYVARDGSPAAYDPNNVPFQPDHHLSVSARDLNEGDFVFVLGYPGSTSRHASAIEVANTFDWSYPTWTTHMADWISAIETAAPEGSPARLAYESRLAGLNNFAKNLVGQIEGAERVDLVTRRTARENALRVWVSESDPEGITAQNLLQLADVDEQIAAAERRDFWYDAVRRPQLLSAARRIYRLAHERQKPDADREPGYQERDLAFIRQSLEAVDRRFDPGVDQAEWQVFLSGYLDQPAAARIRAYDQAIGLDAASTDEEIAERLAGFYANTSLDQLETRLALMEADVAALDASEDPFIQIAAAIYENDLALELADEELQGRRARLQPAYIAALRAWADTVGEEFYPDANSTLRLTYGSVVGPAEVNGGGPAFTVIEEIAEKETGETPFNSPPALLAAIEAGDAGAYADQDLGTVPVNFMSNLDVTGGNSGSPTFNARGELVGLLFDGTLDSVNSDWYFDESLTRAIQVDSRYMLWVMDRIDGAQRVLDEMTIVGLPETNDAEAEASRTP